MTYPTPEPTGAFLRVAIEAVTNIGLYLQAEQDLGLHPSCVGGLDQIRRRAGELARALAADWLRTEAYYVAAEPLVEIHDVFANLDDAVSDAERAARECGGVFLVLRAGEVVRRVSPRPTAAAIRHCRRLLECLDDRDFGEAHLLAKQIPEPQRAKWLARIRDAESDYAERCQACADEAYYGGES